MSCTFEQVSSKPLEPFFEKVKKTVISTTFLKLIGWLIIWGGFCFLGVGLDPQEAMKFRGIPFSFTAKKEAIPYLHKNGFLVHVIFY